VISVAAINASGGIATFSNYGASSVDLGAPGVNIQSTLPNNTYGAYSGTSMATPHVSGAAALCASVDPQMRGKALRDAILATTVATPSLSGITSTGGRLDASALYAQCLPPSAPLSGGPDQLTASTTTQQTVDLSWLDNAQNESGFEVQGAAGACTATSTFSTVAQLDAGATAYRHTGLAEGATFCYRVRATSRYLVNGVPVVSDWTLPVEATTLPPPPPYVCSAQPYSWVDMTGGTVLALGDDASAAVSLPFAFPFYGAPRTSVLVSSNGFIQFVEGPANEYQNSALPGTALPNGIIAAFWDDLNPSAATGSGQVRVRTVGTTPGARQFAIAWEGVPHFDVAGNPVTAQIVLDEASGQIALNYQDVLVGSALIDRGASATVGLENPAGNSATQIGFNQAVLSDLSSYQCGIDVPAPPAVPGGLSATAASTSAINVVWTDVANETGYTRELSGTSGITEVAL
ncbi:MAG: S8 family serine peptidase, partial [Gammaproteobacteria bacterium]